MPDQLGTQEGGPCDLDAVVLVSLPHDSSVSFVCLFCLDGHEPNPNPSQNKQNCDIYQSLHGWFPALLTVE